jgi:hypothetical protein
MGLRLLRGSCDMGLELLHATRPWLLLCNFARNRSGITSRFVNPSLGLSRAIPAARDTGEKRNDEVVSERFHAKLLRIACE